MLAWCRTERHPPGWIISKLQRKAPQAASPTSISSIDALPYLNSFQTSPNPSIAQDRGVVDTIGDPDMAGTVEAAPRDGQDPPFPERASAKRTSSAMGVLGNR